jgi:hypothetical protein
MESEPKALAMCLRVLSRALRDLVRHSLLILITNVRQPRGNRTTEVEKVICDVEGHPGDEGISCMECSGTGQR